MAGFVFKLAFGGLIAAIGLLNLCGALIGWRRGRADWHAGRGLRLSADREDDPVGFTTAVWGNVAAGLFALAMAAVLAFS